MFTSVVRQCCQSCLVLLSNQRGSAQLGSPHFGSTWHGMEKHHWRGGGVYRVMHHPCHTAPFLRLFILNSLTVHPRSSSLKAVLAASFCLVTPCSDYSPAVTSAPFLRPARLELFPVNLPEDPVVSHSLVTLIHRIFTLSGEAGASVLLVPPPCDIPIFPFRRGSTPP
jgi:hypothetical protein